MWTLATVWQLPTLPSVPEYCRAHGARTIGVHAVTSVGRRLREPRPPAWLLHNAVMRVISATSPRHGQVRRRGRHGQVRHGGRQRMAAWVYYGGLCVLLALIVSKTLADLIPGTVGRHIANDSEGYVLALLLPPWIEYARPRLAGRRVEWAITATAAVVMFGIFVFLYNTHSVTGSVKTLDETFFALAFLVPYVQMARRPPASVAGGCALGVLVVVLVTDHSSLLGLTTNLAEGYVMLILAPVAFDVTDRGILQPGRPSRLRVRQVWWVLLVFLPLLFIVMWHAHLGGPLGAADRYAIRAQEAFAGMFLLEIYFAVRQSRWLNQGREAPARDAGRP